MVCNSTVELGPNSRALLARPKGGDGKSLTCWLVDDHQFHHHHARGQVVNSIDAFRYILKLVPAFHSGGLIRVKVKDLSELLARKRFPG